MLLAYPVIFNLKKNIIANITVPDLNIAWEINEEDALGSIDHLIKQKILDQLAQYEYSIPKPRTINYYEEQLIRLTNSNDFSFIASVKINYDIKKGPFEKILPIFGYVVNTTGLLLNSFVMLVALLVTAGTDDKKSLSWGIIGSLFSLFVMLTMYIFSGASDMLRSMGINLDNKFTLCKKPYGQVRFFTETTPLLIANNEEQAFCVRQNENASCIKFSTKMGIFILILGSNVLNAIKLYQETTSLGEKAITKFESLEQTISSDFVTIFSLFYVASLTLGNLAFQGAFGRQFISWIEDKITATESNRDVYERNFST